MPPPLEKPTCISLILCDSVFRDEHTKKVLLVGTFNRIEASELPCRHPKLCVFFTLTNGRGEVDLRVQVEHEQSGTHVVNMGGPLRLENPLALNDMHLEFEGLEFKADGKYWVQILADGEIIQQRPFFVTRVEPEDVEH